MSAVDDTYEDLEFPPQGVSLLAEFDEQPPGTTPIGRNVRFFEALTRRGRGGSRCGLSKLFGSAITPGPVQHLAVIATVSAADTLAANDPFQQLTFPAAIFDPSTNNRANGGGVGQPGPDGNTGGPGPGTTTGTGGGAGIPGGGTGSTGSTGPGPGDTSLSFDQQVRNKGRKVRPGGSGIQPIRGFPLTLPDGSQPSPGHPTVTAVIAQYNPDNVPYVYVLNITGVGLQAFAVGTGFQPPDPWHVNDHVLVARNTDTTQDGFGVPGGREVVTILGK